MENRANHFILFQHQRDRGFLIRGVLVILGVCIMLGFVMAKFAKSAMTEEDKALAEAGRAIYRGGYAERGITACMSCHGPSGHGIPKNYPRVSAQHQSYLEQQLLLYKKGERTGYNNVMPNIAFGRSEQQIKELAAYMAGLN